MNRSHTEVKKDYDTVYCTLFVEIVVASNHTQGSPKGGPSLPFERMDFLPVLKIYVKGNVLFVR